MRVTMQLDEKELVEFLAMLDELGEKAMPKVLLSGVTKAGRALVKRAKANAPVLTGAMRRSVKMYRRKGSIIRAVNLAAGNVERVIGPTIQKPPSPKAKSKKPVRYGWIQEAQRPWLRPAFDSEEANAARLGFEAIIKKVTDLWEKGKLEAEGGE